MMNSTYDDVITNLPIQTPDNSFTGWLKWLFFNRYMLIILILAFLGINLLSYLDAVVRAIVGLLRPLFALFGYTIGETAKETVKIVKTGSNDIINVTAGTLTGGINLLEKGLSGKSTNGSGSNTGKNIKNNIPKKPKSSSFPIPDEAGSRTQASKAKSNAGYCYIGEDRGFRSCIQVNDSDSCMSGDIFPTQEICINPRLRQ